MTIGLPPYRVQPVYVSVLCWDPSACKSRHNVMQSNRAACNPMCIQTPCQRPLRLHTELMIFVRRITRRAAVIGLLRRRLCRRDAPDRFYRHCIARSTLPTPAVPIAVQYSTTARSVIYVYVTFGASSMFRRSIT